MRLGKKREPHYRIVVSEARSKRNGEYVDQVGQYHPIAEKEQQLVLDAEKIKSWLEKGVQPTETVRDIFANAKLVEKVKKVEKKREPKGKKK